MGGLLKEGTWVQKDEWEKGEDKSFERQTSSFRERVEQSAEATHPAEMGRYHLYVSYACPWAHRTLVVRALMGLEEALPISVVNPFMGDQGWTFKEAPGVIQDPVLGAEYLRELYVEAKSDYTGRVTVPVLWDKARGTIVNNESRDIIRMMSRGFSSLAQHEEVDLCPRELTEQVDEAIDAIYEPINNGVYKCGFAGSQEAYDRAFEELFEALGRFDERLGRQRYVCGDRLTEADVCLFTTLYRFDAVYYVHFKCNQRLIKDYENLSGFLREMYQLPGVASICEMDHIKQHYYRSHPQLNPKRIVPRGPQLDFEAPHGRSHL